MRMSVYTGLFRKSKNVEKIYKEMQKTIYKFNKEECRSRKKIIQKKQPFISEMASYVECFFIV